MSIIINLAKLEETATHLKKLSDNIPSMISDIQLLMKWAKILSLQTIEFYSIHDLFCEIFLRDCRRDPNKSHPFWKFLHTDQFHNGEFDNSNIFDEEFLQFKDSYLKNLQKEIDEKLKSFEEQCPIAELKSLNNQFDGFFQKYNEITLHRRIHPLSSVESNDEGFDSSLREIHDFFCNFESKVSKCQEKMDVLEANMVEWGYENDTKMEDIFNSFVKLITRNDGEGCWTDLDVGIYENIEFRHLFQLQRVQRMNALILFDGLFVNDAYINRNFLEEDYTDDEFQREMLEIGYEN
jgi:hypothetical protein